MRTITLTSIAAVGVVVQVKVKVFAACEEHFTPQFKYILSDAAAAVTITLLDMVTPVTVTDWELLLQPAVVSVTVVLFITA